MNQLQSERIRILKGLFLMGDEEIPGEEWKELFTEEEVEFVLDLLEMSDETAHQIPDLGDSERAKCLLKISINRHNQLALPEPIRSTLVVDYSDYVQHWRMKKAREYVSDCFNGLLIDFSCLLDPRWPA